LAASPTGVADVNLCGQRFFGTNWIGRFSAGKRHLMMMVDFEAGDPTGSPLFLRPANAKVS